MGMIVRTWLAVVLIFMRAREAVNLSLRGRVPTVARGMRGEQWVLEARDPRLEVRGRGPERRGRGTTAVVEINIIIARLGKIDRNRCNARGSICSVPNLLDARRIRPPDSHPLVRIALIIGNAFHCISGIVVHTKDDEVPDCRSGQGDR